MTIPGPPSDDAVGAALLQITQHAERLALLDDRETRHTTQLAERLRELTAQLSGIATRVDHLAERVTTIATTSMTPNAGPCCPTFKITILPVFTHR